MLLGFTGSGKTTFVDAMVNYVFDTRYADEVDQNGQGGICKKQSPSCFPDG